MATASQSYLRLLCATCVWCCILMTLTAALTNDAYRSVSRRIRLSLGSDPASLTVTWATDGPQIGRAACVQWYVYSAAIKGEVAKGEKHQQQLFTPLQDPEGSDHRVLCRSNASVPFYDPGANETTQVIHSLTLHDLPEESRDISYRVAVVVTHDSLTTTWSEWYSTRAPVSPTATQARLLMFGDLGLYNAPARPYLIQDAAAGFDGRPYDAAVHVGDIAYDLHSLEGRRSSQFLESVEPLASRLPYMVAPGNHEAWCNFSHYKQLFRMPGHQETASLYYSFDVGPAHVVVYNTEAFFWPDCFDEEYMRQMWEWLDKDLELANANRQAKPWIIVAGHRPMYCARPHLVTGLCGNEARASQQGIPSVCPHNNPFLCRPVDKKDRKRFPIEGLFHRHGVDLAVYGHIHDYERYLPVFNYSIITTTTGRASVSTSTSSSPPPPSRYVAPRATVHITAGGAGNSEMKKGDCLPNKGPCDNEAPWCTFQSGFAPEGCESSDHSFGRLAIYNTTHLRWQHWSYSFQGVEDEWWIIQPFHGSFA